MKVTMFYILVFSFFTLFLSGQNRILHGRVIDQDLGPLPQVRIQTIDTLLLVLTDFDGNFSVVVPKETEKLLLSWIGMEWITIELLSDCDNLEIIGMFSGTYDFMSFRKVDRLRLKQFKKLPELHKKAFEKGLFLKEKPCYGREFEAIKPRLDEIKRTRTTSP